MMSDDASQLEHWIETMRSSSATKNLECIEESRTVVLDAHRSPEVVVNGAPRGWRLRIENAGRDSSVNLFRIGVDWVEANPKTLPATIIIDGLARSVHRLEISTAPRRLADLQIQMGDPRDEFLRIVSTDYPGEQLTVSGGSVLLGAEAQWTTISLADTNVKSTGYVPAELRLADRVALHGSLSSDQVRVSPSLILCGEGTLETQYVAPPLPIDEGPWGPNDVAFWIDGPVTLSTRWIATGIQLNSWQRESTVEFRVTKGGETPGPIHFKGPGTISVFGTIIGCTFEEGGTQFTAPGFPLLRIQDGGLVESASGSAELDSGLGSFCSGTVEDPFEPTRVVRADGSELQNFSVFSLSTDDLAALEGAHALNPWIPQPTELKKKQRSMRHKTADEELRRQRAAYFWARLSRLLQEKNATGNTQSNVRVAAARARREAAPRWNRERLLLSAYSLVGYGERVSYPLLLLVLLSGITTLAFADPIREVSIGKLLTTFLQLLVSPLAFFRFTDIPTAEGPLEVVLGLVVRIGGLLLIFFALSAARRVAKAE